MNQKKPTISVVMSVYNSGEFLREAIESILNQTYKDFEFIIIDDGSTDNSREIIQSYSDTRIKLIVNSKNLNLANSLNLGLKQARGDYIVRMDADDVSIPDRLDKQLEFMEKNRELVLSGTYVKILGTKKVKSYPLSYDECKLGLIFNSVFAHPSVIMKKDFFIDNNLFYNPKFERGQDYELWTRVALLGAIGNLDEALCYYRMKEKDVEQDDLKKVESAKIIRREYLSRLNVKYSAQELILHNKISLNRGLTLKDLFAVSDWFKKVRNSTGGHINYSQACEKLLETKRKRLLSPKQISKSLIYRTIKTIKLQI